MKFIVEQKETAKPFTVYRRGTYGRGSVREGQEYNAFIDAYPTLKEAQAEHPGAELWASKPPTPRMPESPPSWFDPAAAGERW